MRWREGSPMAKSIPLTWRMRKWFWSRWQVLRFSVAKQRKIALPKPNARKIDAVPFGEVYAKVPLKEVLVFDRLPKEEAALGMRVLVVVGLFLNRVVPPMKVDPCEIHARDQYERLMVGKRGLRTEKRC
jgi:hypothetical protein